VLLPSPRLDELLSLAEEADGKVIIWSSFVVVIKMLTSALNKKFGVPGQEMVAAPFHGDVGPILRQNTIDRFQNPNSQVRFFVGQVRTGGLGLTLTAANLVIYHDHDWSLEARAQSEDRAHRIGQEKSVTYVDLVAPGTVDEVILTALREKKDLADLVTGDGWRRLLRA
jgi:SWI/SNF-related matrix-associated actin-dependent regulator 1 of chromatin subfamily A